MALKTKTLTLGLPWNLGHVDFEINDAEARAAWDLYVELMTRVAIQPFDPTCGLMRSALTSLYSLFALTRDVLRQAGPQVAHGPRSFGPVAIAVLTEGIAPFTTRWHQPLLEYELARPPQMSALLYEKEWKEYAQMRAEFAALQEQLHVYAAVLAAICGIRD